MQFNSLDDFISADNPVRIIDAFVENPLVQPKIETPEQIGRLPKLYST